MKYLCSVYDRSEANEIVSLFHSQGIPLILSNLNAAGNKSGSTVAIDIWVGIDSQLHEAKMLLNFPTYSVENPVDAAQFHRILDELRKQPSSFPTILMNTFVCSVLIGLIAWLAWAITTNLDK